MNVFITGASSGIGAALARHYAAQGARLGLFARREAALAEVAESIRADGRNAPPRDDSGAAIHLYAGDVRDAAALQTAAAAFLHDAGVPDVVIANAGVSRGTSTEHVEDLAVFREVLEINVLGMVHTFQPFLAGMRARRAGVLAGIASVAGFRGLPGSAAYSASKAAAISYLESLRVELRAGGVAVVTICPGYVATPMTAGNPYPMPFLMQPDVAARRIARAIAARRRLSVLAWPMALAGRVLRALPRPVYDRAFARAPRKPRLGDTPDA
jgi:short-subunit dehydrogenase